VEEDPRSQVFKIDTKSMSTADHLNVAAKFCTIYWNTKKSLLKNKYGIDWCSPGELNPQVLFD
jgi:hypothetical protein